MTTTILFRLTCGTRCRIHTCISEIVMGQTPDPQKLPCSAVAFSSSLISALPVDLNFDKYKYALLFATIMYYYHG